MTGTHEWNQMVTRQLRTFQEERMAETKIETGKRKVYISQGIKLSRCNKETEIQSDSNKIAVYLFLCPDVGGQSGASRQLCSMRSAGFQIPSFFVSHLPVITSISAMFQPMGKEKEKWNIGISSSHDMTQKLCISLPLTSRLLNLMLSFQEAWEMQFITGLAQPPKI